MTGAQQDRDVQEAAPEKAPAEPAKRYDLLNHFNARDLKVFFRCWVGVWVGSLFMFIGPTLHGLGQATFFVSLVQLFLPPSGIVMIHLLGALSLFLGMFVAWAWGVIVMKAALAARPAADTQARLQSLQQTAAQQANATGIAPAAAAQRLVFDGYMLDTRVTVVTYCLICLFIYLLARLRASNPKTTMTQVFGTIISDIFLCYAPAIPSFSGTLPLLIVKPAAVGVGLSFVCSIIFFPRSTSHTVLDNLKDIVALLKVPLELTGSSVTKDAERLDLKILRATRAKIIAAVRQSDQAFAFLPIDLSVGYWSADDIGSLKVPARHLLASTLGLLEFQIKRVHQEIRTEDLMMFHDYLEKEQDSTDKAAHQVGRHQLSQLAEMLDAIQCPDNHAFHDDLANEFALSSSEAITCGLEGFGLIMECITIVNERRWFSRPSQTEREEFMQRTRACLDKLQETRTLFVKETTELFLREYTPLLEKYSGQVPPLEAVHELRGLVLGMVFQEHLSTVLQRTEALLARMLALFQQSSRVRLWLPSSLRYALKWVNGKKGDAPVKAHTTDPDPDKTEELTKAAQEKLRITRHYRVRQRSGLGRAILGVYHWFTSNDGLYALRMVVVTIALSVPGVIPRTAGFYYREKGLWALIMGQTGLLVYMADFTFSVISRVLGTVIGGVLGLLAWYIGSANGQGNPYGLGAVMAVMLAILMWVRLWCPPSLVLAGIMAGATFLLTVGYSYDDAHIPQYGSPGVGYNVFWRRLVLVLIGAAGALIVQMFPSPPSAARHISKTLSNSIRAISDHYALMLSCWNHAGNNGQALAEPLTLKLAESLLDLEGPIQLLKLEFSSSRFDSASLNQIKDLCATLNRELGQLLFLSTSLPHEYQARLAQVSGMLDHRHIGEIMAVLGVCEQALKTGDPPPEILPTPLVKRTFEYRQQNQVQLTLTPETVQDENYRRFCVALSSYLKFLGTVDELTLVIKGAVGEAHLVSKDLIDFV